MRMTEAQWFELAAAVAERDLTLEDREDTRTRLVLNRAWSRLQELRRADVL